MADPLYGMLSAEAEHAALRRAVQALALGCRGLLSYLLKLRARWGAGGSGQRARQEQRQGLQMQAALCTTVPQLQIPTPPLNCRHVFAPRAPPPCAAGAAAGRRRCR